VGHNPPSAHTIPVTRGGPRDPHLLLAAEHHAHCLLRIPAIWWGKGEHPHTYLTKFQDLPQGVGVPILLPRSPVGRSRGCGPKFPRGRMGSSTRSIHLGESVDDTPPGEYGLQWFSTPQGQYQDPYVSCLVSGQMLVLKRNQCKSAILMNYCGCSDTQPS